MRITSTICLLSLFAIGCGSETGNSISDAPVAESPGAETSAPAAPPATANSGDNERAVGATIAEYQPVTLEVPTMMCPFNCYPAVKETLEVQPGVASVELVPQKKEGEIDDRRVVVNVKEGFNADEAIAALSKAGYEDAAVQN